ncbi:MAG: hypothetical protein E7554_01030 [Ruminococcaceae bacterium]|nr:hypothetical protein [Oscillospiraceae bacterium]
MSGRDDKPVIRPNSNGYVPAPLDTGKVVLSDNIMLLGERLAANFHDVWGKGRADEGWGYGLTRDDEKKTNPCMVYYDELTEEQKEDDRISALEALRFIKAKGYTIEERKSPNMSEVYRMAWTDHGRSDDEINFDATVFVGMFGSDGYADKTRLTKAVHSFCVSLYDLFDEKKALGSDKGVTMVNSARYKKYAHTRFAFLSPMETENEQLAARIAAGYGIVTYRVAGDKASADKCDIVAPDGDVTGFICDNSLFALAMWNGLKETQNGYDERMALIVRRALRGSTERLMELDMPDNITVYHLLLPMDSSDRGCAGHSAYGVRALYPYPLETGRSWYFRGGKSKSESADEYNRKRFERNVGKIEHFNRKIKKRRDDVMSSEKVYDLMPGLHGHTRTDRDLLRHLYTDSISFTAQKKRDRQTKWMMWMAMIGLGAYSLMSDAPEVMFGINTSALAPVLSAVVLLFLTAAMCIFFYQRRTGSHDEYVGFRMISECLRVQTYWRASGVEGSVEKEFGAKSKLDFEWARYIFRSWELENLISTPESREFSPEIINEVARIWHGREEIWKKDSENHEGGGYRYESTDGVDQYGYTRRKAARSVKDAKREGIVKVISIAVAYGLTAVVAILVIISTFVSGSASIVDYLMLVASLVQIIVAGYNLYSSTKDYERLANNNTWLSIEYQKAIIACKYTADKQKKRELFRRTGCEAVREVCGWALEFSRNEPGSPVS